jgi:50S ribosomal subunit-associated GTPase HflX
LDDVEGVLLVMDATLDPYNQINITLIGNLEARAIPILIIANKIDVEEASGSAIKDAFPQHFVVPVSAKTGLNIDKLYTAMIKHFR